MNIAINISPLNTGHKVRGTGSYVKSLKGALEKYFPNNTYTFFSDYNDLTSHQDIVHLPYFDPYFFTLPFINKFRIVVTIHDLIPLVFPEHFPSGFRGKIKWLIQKQLLKKVSAIITDSSTSKRDIIKLAGVDDKMISVVHLAASDDFHFRLRSSLLLKIIIKKYNLPDKFILYVGDATWNKNLPRIIRAIKSLDIPAFFVGSALAKKEIKLSDPWSNDLRIAQELCRGDKNISILGFVPQEDLAGLYKAATVFIMPSLYEGFGLGVIEAMQSGCPVVTSREGSLGEVAGDSAFYVNANDEISIAEGIKKVFYDTTLQESLRKKGIKHSQNFSWKITAEQTLDVYKKIIK